MVNNFATIPYLLIYESHLADYITLWCHAQLPSDPEYKAKVIWGYYQEDAKAGKVAAATDGFIELPVFDGAAIG